MAQNLTTFDAALKQIYTSDEVIWLTYRDHPLMAMLAKKTDFTGKNLPIPIVYGNSQGRSRQFADAQLVASTSSAYARVEDFVLTRVKDYALARIDGETMKATKGDAGAFLDAARTEIDSAFDAIASSMAHALYRDGKGVKASSAAGTAAALTLPDANDVVHFEVGMAVEVWDNSAESIVRAATFTNGVVSAVDRDAGTVTLPVAWNTAFGITLATDGTDKILQYGDGLDGGSVLGRGKISGLDAWIPGTAPSSGDAFFGVDRSVDTNRLAGVRSDGSGKDLEAAYIDGLTRCQREGGRPNMIFVTYEDWANLDKALGSKKVEMEVKVTQEIGFRGLQIIGPKGPAAVIPDQDALPGVAFGLDMRYIKVYSLGMAPQLLDDDGNSMLRISNEDGVEVRAGYYAQLGMRAPGFNFRLTLPT